MRKREEDKRGWCVCGAIGVGRGGVGGGGRREWRNTP